MATQPRAEWPQAAPPITPARRRREPAWRRGISAAALMQMDFPPINYVVPDYVAEGLTLLAGAPKIGKSWMSLGLGVAIASGRPAFGSIPVDQGDVLYLALEDNARRLKRRLLKMGVTTPPERLTLCTDWPGLDEGCVDEIAEWIASVEKPTLIVVDVLSKVRPSDGGKARLALDLMLWTGQRGGDARVMGPGAVRNKRLVVKQEKTGVIVSVPILPALAESILAAPSGGLVFLLSDHGKPFSRKGFGNKMRQWCDEAGLPGSSAHGLRKAAARRFAEAGCSNQEIKAWTGHTTDSEVSRYTAAASQTLLSDAAADKLMANLRKRLANRDANPSEMEA